MAQTVEIETLQPTQVLCDRCDASARKPATFHYLWDWGEQGHACSEHTQVLQQTAGQLSRNISVHPLQPSAAEPLQRDERTRLKANALVLEEELNDAKNRGLELYRVNTQLRGDVQLHKVRATELEAQIADARKENTRLAAELDKRDVEHGQLVLELERLKTLAAFGPSERQQLGLSDEDDPSVVDG